MLNLAISELRSIAIGSNIDGYKIMSKEQLENLFTKPKKMLLNTYTYTIYYLLFTKIPIPIPRPKKPMSLQ